MTLSYADLLKLKRWNTPTYNGEPRSGTIYMRAIVLAVSTRTRPITDSKSPTAAVIAVQQE